jgi:ABC-type polar amino acid transport system ATPase subunit
MLKISKLNKSFKGHQVLKNIDLEISKGEVIALIGPSGSGKSTLIRCINELELYDSGIVEKNLSPHQIGMVFQHFNLFPHMTALENAIYAPQAVLKRSREESEKVAREMLTKVGLAEHMHKYPKKLSGGQKQRAAIARTLSMNPEIILFDEPTSALDPENIKEVQNVIKNLTDTGITALLVTHDLNFARDVASRVLFMENGQILATGSVDEVIINPKLERIAQFASQITA